MDLLDPLKDENLEDYVVEEEVEEEDEFAGLSEEDSQRSGVSESEDAE